MTRVLQRSSVMRVRYALRTFSRKTTVEHPETGVDVNLNLLRACMCFLIAYRMARKIDNLEETMRKC
jgi:hypothetical protein